MSSRFLSLLLTGAVLLGPASPTALAQKGGDKRSRSDPIVSLERWTKQVRRNGPAVGLDELQSIEQLVADVRMLQISEPERREEAVLALLDLAGVRSTKEMRARRTNRVEGVQIGRQTDRIRDYGREALTAILAADSEGRLADWLAIQVLSQPEQSADRRIASLHLIGGAHRSSTMLAVFACAIDEERDVRDAAMNALVGWPADDVHRFMLQQLERLPEDPDWVSRRTVREHFATAPVDPAAPGGAALFAYTSQRMLATEWRDAYRGIQLMAAVPNDPAVPSLIEALSVWGDRRARGGGSRRIESELIKELERRSGRRIGNHPERWATWWKAVSSGALPATSPDSPGQRTKAAFFGLRPVTDRVVFVIDRSGSMTAAFGEGGNTRYGEAVEQMLNFLRELGPTTRFRVILFSNEPEIWKDRLQPATEANLKTVERWLRYHPPRGGTFLRPALDEVLRLDRTGRMKLDRIEEDSVVVLCDGATAQGPGWVPAWLETGEDACLAYHCVQIGRSSDGTLEALAEGSGGDFVEVRD